MIFNHHNLVKYRLRPNKKTEGTPCALRLWTSGCLDDGIEQAKVMKVLCKIHRVNPNAIEDLHYTLLNRELKGMKWIREKVAAIKARFA